MIIAGPCAIEGKEFVDLAKQLKSLGATHIRGGVFKPRTSPHRWAGLGTDAIKWAVEMKEQTGMPLVAEAMHWKQIEQLYDVVDIFQIGSRNQTDSELLRDFGRQDKPVLLKRGMATSIEEFLMYTEYIRVEGNNKIILCERGIRTFETYTRNTFDINCIAAVRKITKMPILADPSHGTGRAELVIPIALAGLVAGADGLLIEVHNNPVLAKTDGRQSITVEEFKILMGKIEKLKQSGVFDE